jgi:hypothetical protein
MLIKSQIKIDRCENLAPIAEIDDKDIGIDFYAHSQVTIGLLVGNKGYQYMVQETRVIGFWDLQMRAFQRSNLTSFLFMDFKHRVVILIWVYTQTL